MPEKQTRDRTYDLLWWFALLLPVVGITAWHAQLLYPLSYLFGKINGVFAFGGIHSVSLWLGPLTLAIFSLPVVFWPGRLRPALQWYTAILFIDIALKELLIFLGTLHSNDNSWAFVGLLLMPVYIAAYFFVYFSAAFAVVILRKYLQPPKTILLGLALIGALLCAYDYTVQVGLVIAKMQSGWGEVVEYGNMGGTLHAPEFKLLPEPPAVSQYIERYSKEGWRAHCALFPKPWSSEYIPQNDYSMCNAAGALHFSDPSFCTGLPETGGKSLSFDNPRMKCIFGVVVKTGDPTVCAGFADVAGCRAQFNIQNEMVESGRTTKAMVDHCNAVRPSQPYTLDPREEVYTDLVQALAHPDNVKVLALHGLQHLPSEIGKFKNLQLLDLSANVLTELPPEIDELTQLRVLNVTNNMLKGFPPLTRLCLLERIDIRNNLMDVGTTTDIARSLGLLNPNAVKLYHPQKGWNPIGSSSSSIAAMPTPRFGFDCRRSDDSMPPDQSMFVNGYVYGDAIMQKVDGTWMLVKRYNYCDGNALMQNRCIQQCKPGDLCFYTGSVDCPHGCGDGACVR